MQQYSSTSTDMPARPSMPITAPAQDQMTAILASPTLSRQLSALLQAPWCPSYLLAGIAKQLLASRGRATGERLDPQQVSLLANVAAHSQTSASTIADLVVEPTAPTVRRHLARSLRATPEHLDVLARDPDWETRLHVAANPATSENTLRSLAEDKDPSVRAAVIANPHSPAQLLKDILNGPADLQSIRAAAANPLLPISVACLWADHHAPTVRAAVAASQPLPEQTMLRLADDPEPRVQRYLASNPTLPRAVSDYLADPGQQLNTRIALAANAGLNVANAVNLLVDSSSLVRRRAALHQHALSSAVLTQAALDEDDPRVLAALVRHPNLPERVTHNLLGRLASSPHASRAFVRAAAHHLTHLNPDTAYLIAGLHDMASTSALVARPDCPLTIFAASARHPLPQLRRATAANPNCPPGTLDALRSDPDPITALIAANHLQASG